MNLQILFVLILFAHSSYKDPSCAFDENRPLDKRIIAIQKKIEMGAKDTLIIYRHQITVNQETGYARIILKSKEKTLRKDFALPEKLTQIIESKWYEIEDAELTNIISSINPTNEEERFQQTNGFPTLKWKIPILLPQQESRYEAADNFDCRIVSGDLRAPLFYSGTTVVFSFQTAS